MNLLPSLLSPNQFNHLRSPPIFIPNIHPVTDPSYTVGLYKKPKLHVKYSTSKHVHPDGISTVGSPRIARVYVYGPFSPIESRRTGWFVPLIAGDFVRVLSMIRIIGDWV